MCDQGCKSWTKRENLCANCSDWRRILEAGSAEECRIEDLRSGWWVCQPDEDEYRQVATGSFVQAEEGGKQWFRVDFTDGSYVIRNLGTVFFKSTRMRSM